MKEVEIYENISLDNLYRIEAISWYNHNYYVGFKREGKCASDLLYTVSDDDDTSDIFIVQDNGLWYIGYCFASEGNKIRIE